MGERTDNEGRTGHKIQLTGKALLEGVSLTDKYILTSGCIPMDMIQKGAAIRVPVIVSRPTPTIAAVETARKAGITLLGVSREAGSVIE